ncbi:MAG: hypothetical protein EKK41_28410 [Hyphomicrobiales bacterium]|nr:MAG: hypothetical protein EKK41_28410 [Hyphomicrobiales bacterium]
MRKSGDEPHNRFSCELPCRERSPAQIFVSATSQSWRRLSRFKYLRGDMLHPLLTYLVRQNAGVFFALIVAVNVVCGATVSSAAPPLDVQKLNFLYVELGKCGVRRDAATDDLVYEAVKFAAMNSPGFITPKDSLDARLIDLAKLMIGKLQFEFSDGSICSKYRSPEMTGKKLFEFIAAHAVIGIIDARKK